MPMFNLKSYKAAVAAASKEKPLIDLLLALCEGGVSSNFVTATATAGAATANKALAGVITSEALTTAAAGIYTLTVTDDVIGANDQVVCTLEQGTNTIADIVLLTVTPAAGSFVAKIKNTHASSALNGTIKVRFSVVKGA